MGTLANYCCQKRRRRECREFREESLLRTLRPALPRLGSFCRLLGSSAPIYLLFKAAGTAVSSTAPLRRGYDRHWTPVHLDFVVEEIESAVRQAVDAGARLESAISTHKWGRLALMVDPFGHGFCFVQFLGCGYDEIAG